MTVPVHVRVGRAAQGRGGLANAVNGAASSAFIAKSCSSAMPPELGGGAVITWKPRQSLSIGVRQTAL